MSEVTGDGATRLSNDGFSLDDPMKWPETYRLVKFGVSPDLKIIVRRPTLVCFPVQGPGNHVTHITREVPIR